jgi:nicotinamide riboside transporter PnuC
MENFLKNSTWILTAMSVIGAYLNVKKKRISFLLYTIANIGWILTNLYFEIYSQAALFFVFTLLSTYGWIEWGRK